MPPKKSTLKKKVPLKKTTLKKGVPPKKSTVKKTIPPKKSTLKKSVPPKKANLKLISNTIIQCKEGFVRNPNTNRCIKKGGAVYNHLMKTTETVNKLPLSTPKKARAKVADHRTPLFEMQSWWSDFSVGTTIFGGSLHDTTADFTRELIWEAKTMTELKVVLVKRFGARQYRMMDFYDGDDPDDEEDKLTAYNINHPNQYIRWNKDLTPIMRRMAKYVGSHYAEPVMNLGDKEKIKKV